LLLTWSPWLAATAEERGAEDETDTLGESDEGGETAGAGRAWSGIGSGERVRAGNEEDWSSVTVPVAAEVAVEVAEALGWEVGVAGRDSLTRAAFAAFSG
jgi:hypothetical protein